ncbi:unnamed protein product [Ixodes persulcatus]
MKLQQVESSARNGRACSRVFAFISLSSGSMFRNSLDSGVMFDFRWELNYIWLFRPLAFLSCNILRQQPKGAPNMTGTQSGLRLRQRPSSKCTTMGFSFFARMKPRFKVSNSKTGY